MPESTQRISDFDSRIVYLPNDEAPSGCVDDANDQGCSSRWWFYNVSGITQHISVGPKASLEFTFIGVGVNLWGSTSGAGAVAHASVDSGAVSVVNFASEDRNPHDNVLLLSQSDLVNGTHTLRIAYDLASYGDVGNRKFLVVDWLEVLQAGRREQPSSTTTASVGPTVTISPSTTRPISITASAPAVHSSAPVSVKTQMVTVTTVRDGLSTILSTITVLGGLDPLPQPSSSQTVLPSVSAAAMSSRLRIIIPVGILAVVAILAMAILACILRRRRGRRDKEVDRRPSSSQDGTHPFIFTQDETSPIDLSHRVRPYSKLNSMLDSHSQPPAVAYEPSINSMDSGSTKVE
ncbi:hypothetical protein AURDEDRAFT_128728 [Auricularia subglabra TFB-10046 SS5]|nr:hypothetical protein AURDEDRAFT_128728 [Auricularia subglabra TFB-10046 SS5]